MLEPSVPPVGSTVTGTSVFPVSPVKYNMKAEKNKHIKSVWVIAKFQNLFQSAIIAGQEYKLCPSKLSAT